MTDVEIRYIDRLTGKEEKEKIYGRIFIHALYGKGWVPALVSFFFLPLFARVPFFSKLYGCCQKSRISRSKIKPFIEKFHVNTSEFLEPVETFESFNDFFIRKLKPSARPIAGDHRVAVLPADGRYLAYPNVEQTDGFLIKGQKFSLEKLLCDKQLAKRYAQGAMVIVRLCPTDYHRFHFPCACVPGKSQHIPGDLYSVNPLALKKNIEIFTQNKRMITALDTESFGTVLYIEVGATYVGSIEQTYVPGKHCAKGAEKGYFAFGGSSLILLFEPSRIAFDQDLIATSKRKVEMRGLLGQSLGHILSQ